MRTTVNLTPDLEAEVARLRRDEGLGTSDAVVLLARRGLQRRDTAAPFRQRAHSLEARLDVANVAEVLDLLDDDPA